MFKQGHRDKKAFLVWFGFWQSLHFESSSALWGTVKTLNIYVGLCSV